MYLINTIIGAIYLVLAIAGLFHLAFRNARRPVQKNAEKEPELKPINPVHHRAAAFRATIHTNPLCKLQ